MASQDSGQGEGPPRGAWSKLLGALRMVFVVGPDPPEAYHASDEAEKKDSSSGEPSGDAQEALPAGDRPRARRREKASAGTWSDTLLTWPVRLIIVAGAALVGYVWAPTPGGVQLGWGLQYALVIAVAIVISFWKWIFLVNAVVGGAWVGFAIWEGRAIGKHGRLQLLTDEPRWGLSDVTTWVNRQVEHIEILATWVALALITSSRLDRQLLQLAGVALLGGPLINLGGRLRYQRRQPRNGMPPTRADLLMERRVFIYAATLVGLALLWALAPEQLIVMLPLFLATIIGVGLRILRFSLRARLDGDDQSRAYRRHRAKLQQRSSHLTGWIGPTLVAGFFVAVALASSYFRHQLAIEASIERDGPPLPADKCAAQPGGPKEASLALFLLADTQMHELGGAAFPGRMEVADTLVPVARRPVELDMLSTATVVRTQAVYDELASKRPPGAPLLWAHLGDFADMSCMGEMRRMLGLLRGYGKVPHRLAGIAAGNHDSSFTGNFAWSPYWKSSCPTGRMDKAGSDRQLGEFLSGPGVLADGAITQTVSGWGAPSALDGSLLARYTVTPLGTIPLGDGRARGVIAIFLDTSDRGQRDFGVSGEFGSFSPRQEIEILDAVEKLQRSRSGEPAYADPWYVLLGHVPYGALTKPSRAALDDLIQRLDGRGDDCKPYDERCHRARVIGLLTAHTHTAEAHRHCVAQRLVREVVIGSVIDPPQQAALLEIGLDQRGRGALRVSTLPTVARAGLTCDSSHMIDAGVCQRAMALLAAAPECQGLVASVDTGEEAGATCETLERPLSLEAQVDGIVRHGGPADGDELELAENRRARALLNCVCRPSPTSKSGIAQPPKECLAREPPLKDERYAQVIESLARDPDRQTEMACLSWAAAAVQRHKAAGMTMADAIRCAFDDPTLEPAQVTVATAEYEPCY